ncbi:hypothetical protein LAZ67_20001109 [Cordylochernes scorpioides]|uniref:Integrase catalytic domain-containing protein n=1 Tax=Cordylochernes scorpioides TaxID=51811 RepID=A0ABY6LLC5_9ARAC|nr:hypothetical protein LAZ67_20001109 [Cordylochernes scorpioides]
MQQHITTMMELVDKLRTIGETLKDSHITAILLCSLPKSYSNLITMLESRPDDELTLEFTKNKLLDEHTRRVESSKDESTASKALKSLHRASSQRREKEKKFCSFCHKPNHSKEECWHYQKRNNSNKEYKYENFRRGNVPKYTNQSSVTQEQPTNQRTTKGPNPKALNCTQREASVHNWFIDSGATSHMAYDERIFTALNREQTQNVVVANGNKLQVKGIGQGEIKVITPQGKTDTLLLTKVLYIPELTDNLLSVSAATSNGCKVTFNRDWCTIERDNTALANGILDNGMYRLHLDDNPQTRTFKANLFIYAYEKKEVRTYRSLKSERQGLQPVQGFRGDRVEIGDSSIEFVQRALRVAAPTQTGAQYSAVEKINAKAEVRRVLASLPQEEPASLWRILLRDDSFPFNLHFSKFIDQAINPHCIICTRKIQEHNCRFQSQLEAIFDEGCQGCNPIATTPVASETRLFHRDFWVQNGKKRNWTKICCADCVQCIQGKLTETPFPKKTEYRATETLQLVHSDICGPLPTNSLSGKRYFITFTDDYSRYTKIYLLKGKDEAYEKIKDYVISAHTEFRKNIQTIRTDNGREYVNRQVEDFLNQSGIKHQLTVPYSPAQNGVAERKNRSLMEMTRCMLFDSGLPQSLWAEAVTTANYLHNRIPSKATDKTPFELWTNRKPSLKHLKRFGCKAFAYIPKIKRNKLDSKVIEGIFLGYDDRSKGYRILHDTDNITISRSVKFIEKENGFHLASTKTTSPQVLSTDLTSSNYIGNAEESQEPGTQPENLEDSETEDYLQPGTSTGTQVVTQRRSTRPTKGIPPIRNDYMLYKTEAQDIPTPTSYSEVLQLPKIEREKWLQAMNEELNSLEKNNVWELTPLPKDKRIIGCKWTYKQKLNSKGEIERYKARLVAKGFNQKFGRDYEETFAPIVKHSTIRAFLAASVYKGMQVNHLDVKTAFLHGDLDKELYMELPEGLHTKQTNKVCKLKKAIYGLKQAGRSWNTKIASTLIKNTFKQSIVDPCLFTKNEENHSIYLILYVDDMLLASDSEIMIQNTVKTLEKEFEIKNLGDPTQFIGIEISRNREGELLLSQKNKIQELVERYNLQEAKPTFTPMESGYPGISDEKLLPNNVQYQQLIGSLLYLSVVSRPDIAAPVCILSSRNQNPRNCDWNAAKRIVRYLKTTKELELRISNQKPPTLEAYSDATWASDNTDRKSLSGNLFLLGSNPISWMTGKQGCVSLSSTEAELISAAEASQELLWLLDLLKDLELEQKAPIYFHQDNQSCLKICSSEKVSSRTKHIATKIHHLKDLQKKTVIKMIYCPTGDMKADILTKPLPRPTFEKLRYNLVIKSIHVVQAMIIMESLNKNLLTENADISEAIDENQEDSSILETTFVIEDEESNKDIGTPKIEISEVSVIDKSEGKYSKEPVVSVEALDKKEMCHDDSAHLNVVEADLNRPKEATSGIINVYTEANESSSKEKVVPVEIVDTSTKDYLQSGEKAKLSRWKPIDSLCLEDVKESEDDDENYNELSSKAPVSLPQFLATISGELALIDQDLATRKSERQARAVPFSLRRRAVSHNIRRFPKRVREKIPKDSITPKTKPPSMKHRKKAKNKKVAFAARQDRVKWLESHVWHAKRFFMSPLWGWKIPLHPTDKCWKAARRMAQKHTFLVGSGKNPHGTLCLVAPVWPREWAETGTRRFGFAFGCERESISASGSVWCSPYDLSYYSILELPGTQASLLESFQGLLPPDCDNFSYDNHVKAVANFYPPRGGAPRCELVLYHRGQYPRGAMGPVLFLWGPDRLWLVVHPQLEEELRGELPGAVPLPQGEVGRHRLLGPEAKNILQSVLGWTSEPNSLTSLTVSDPRLVTPSSRKNGSSRVTSTYSPGAFWSPEVRNGVRKLPDHQICELRNLCTQPGENLELEALQSSIPLLVYHHPDSKGWDVLFPKGWSQPLWIAYIYSGARAFGLRDYKRVSTGAFYPDHYPDTRAGQAHHAQQIQALRDRHYSLPPSKRLNYTFEESEKGSMFQHDWSKMAGGEDFYILRDKRVLSQLQQRLEGKTEVDVSVPGHVLVFVNLTSAGRGTLPQYATVHASPSAGSSGLVLEGEYSQTKGKVTGLALISLDTVLSSSTDHKVFVHPQHCPPDVFYPFLLELPLS